jgi:hypothetical protein
MEKKGHIPLRGSSRRQRWITDRQQTLKTARRGKAQKWEMGVTRRHSCATVAIRCRFHVKGIYQGVEMRRNFLISTAKSQPHESAMEVQVLFDSRPFCSPDGGFQAMN